MTLNGATGALAALGFPNGAVSGALERNRSKMSYGPVLWIARVAKFLQQSFTVSNESLPE
jgi:hypothetical protein